MTNERNNMSKAEMIEQDFWAEDNSETVTADDLVFAPARKGANYRHISLDINVNQFDTQAVIDAYAAEFIADGEAIGDTLNERAEYVAGLLRDDAAKMQFKAAVRKLRNRSKS